MGRAGIWRIQEQENTRQVGRGTEQSIRRELGSSHWVGLQVEDGQITAGPSLGRRRGKVVR